MTLTDTEQAMIARSAALAAKAYSRNDVHATNTHLDEILAIRGGIELAVILWCQAVATHIAESPHATVAGALGQLSHPCRSPQDAADGDALTAMISAIGAGEPAFARIVWGEFGGSDDLAHAADEKSRLSSHALAAAARVAQEGRS